MTSTQLEIYLIYLALFCFAMLFLHFIARTVKIITTKKIESTEDILCVLFWIVFAFPFVAAYYFMQKKFKKETDNKINTEKDGIENMFKM